MIKDELWASFPDPHTPLHSTLPSPTLCSPKVPLTVPTLWASSGPKVHRFPCLYYVGFLTEAISSNITGEIKPTVKMILLVFHFIFLAIKSQNLFAERTLAFSHQNKAGEREAMQTPHTEQATSQFKSELDFHALKLKITCIRWGGDSGRK